MMIYKNVRQYVTMNNKSYPRPDDVENHRDGPGVIPRPMECCHHQKDFKHFNTLSPGKSQMSLDFVTFTGHTTYSSGDA